MSNLSANATKVLAVMAGKAGAQLGELRTRTGLTPAELSDALQEMAAAGLIESIAPLPSDRSFVELIALGFMSAG